MTQTYYKCDAALHFVSTHGLFNGCWKHDRCFNPLNASFYLNCTERNESGVILEVDGEISTSTSTLHLHPLHVLPQWVVVFPAWNLSHKEVAHHHGSDVCVCFNVLSDPC